MGRAEQLRTFIDAQPDEPFPRYALALELKGQGDPQAATAQLEELLRRKPDYLAAYLQLGMLLQVLEKKAEAAVALRKGQDVARAKGDQHTLSELTAALEQL